MATIYTIGHTQKTLEQFIRLLQENQVDVVIDVRLRGTSQLLGFAKQDDLAFLLRHGFDIDYERRPELAPTPEILDGYRANRDWAVYVQAFQPLLRQRGCLIVCRELLRRYQRPCLLCSEPTPEKCHRRLIAEWWAEQLPGLQIVHL